MVSDLRNGTNPTSDALIKTSLRDGKTITTTEFQMNFEQAGI